MARGIIIDYTIHPKKSEEMVLNEVTDGQSELEVKYGDEPIAIVESAAYLGVERCRTGRPDVQQNITEKSPYSFGNFR